MVYLLASKAVEVRRPLEEAMLAIGHLLLRSQMASAQNVIGESQTREVVRVEDSIEGKRHNLYQCLPPWVHGEYSIGKMTTMWGDEDVKIVE